MGNRCADCKHYAYNFTDSYEGQTEWMECKAKPQVANLKHFPFEKTNCADFRRTPPHDQ